MIKAVLFDLDGTLLDRDSSLKSFIELQYKRLRCQLGHIDKTLYIERFIELDCRGYVWKDRVYQQILQEFEIKDITWKELLDDYKQYFKYSCIPFPHLQETLEYLSAKSVKLGMITNGYGQFQMDNIVALDIYHYFKSVLISEWEGMKKPNQSIFQKALRELNVQPYEAVYVGDHPVNDMDGANQVGMKTIWIKNGEQDDVIADYKIDGLDEIPAIIEKHL